MHFHPTDSLNYHCLFSHITRMSKMKCWLHRAIYGRMPYVDAPILAPCRSRR